MLLSNKTIYLIKEYARDNDPTETRKYISQLTGLKKSARNNVYNKIFSGKVDYNLKFKANANTASIEAKDVKTLDELVKLSNVDLTKWNAKKFTANIYAGNYQVKGEFERKKDEEEIKTLLDQFQEQCDKFVPQKFTFEPSISDGKLLILNLQDLHLGKLACNEETNWGNFELKIAKQYYLDAVTDLIEKAPIDQIEKILLIVGSDLLHFDTEQTTTTKGTRLDSDSRWTKVYNEGCSLITQVVEMLASNFIVEVMVITGNHSKLSEYALGSYVKAFFRNHPQVAVNNAPLDRKYFQFGKNLIGFTHGDEIKTTDIPLLMMRENQEIVSQHPNLFCFIGHTHTDKLVEIKGVKVFVAPALCPPDKWHSAHGYVGNVLTSQAILFDPDNGLEAVFYSKSPVKVT